jgi:hypothetical protein
MSKTKAHLMDLAIAERAEKIAAIETALRAVAFDLCQHADARIGTTRWLCDTCVATTALDVIERVAP